MVMRSLLIAASLLVVSGTKVSAHAEYSANPIRRVVNLLQKMHDQVTEEGKAEEENYDKFQCYCKTGTGDLQSSISAAEAKTSSDTSSLEEAEAQSEQLKGDLASHKADRADAKDAVAQATALRNKEAAVYARTHADMTTNLNALGGAITAIESGVSGSFLQTSAAAKLRQLTINMDMSSADRDLMASFLSRQDSSYVPQSGEIIGILKEMKDTMQKGVEDVVATEEQSIKDYDGLMAAKTKEIATNTHAIETKTERKGQTDVDIANLKEALDDAAEAMLADKKFLAELGTNCKTKTAEWEERSKTRADEIVAIAETIKLINDDDALELFKKTLPSPSFLQTTASYGAVRTRAMRALRTSHRNRDPRADLVMLALTGKSKNFDQVIKMVDDLVALLGKEQGDDDDKKAYCEKEIDVTEDQLKDLGRSVDDLDKEISDTKEKISTLTAEIDALVGGVKALDKAVAEATETRKAENAEFKSTLAANKATKELLGVAKNRLAKFYNPALYRSPPKTELSAEQRIAVNLGSEAAPTVAPSGISGTGITYLQLRMSKEAPPPPPETWEAYQKKGQEVSGVTAMMDLLIADVDKDMQSGTVDENNAQEEYETFMSNSQSKRAIDSKLISEKESTKADLEERLQKAGSELKSTKSEAMNTAEILKDLHLDCDWLLSSFGARKEARAGEVESLKNAKAVLSGADYSLLQQVVSRKRLLRGTSAF